MFKSGQKRIHYIPKMTKGQAKQPAVTKIRHKVEI